MFLSVDYATKYEKCQILLHERLVFRLKFVRQSKKYATKMGKIVVLVA
jgi:hypothetical protein